MNDEIRYLGDMQRLQVSPGDVFVLKAKGRLTIEGVLQIREQWKQVMGDAPLLVLDDAISLGAVNREATGGDDVG